MFDCNETITIWNLWNNPAATAQTDKTIWYRHVLPVKCKWKNNVVRDVSGTTANMVNTLLCIIPYSEMYREYDIWKTMGADEREQYFTIQTGDLVALDEQTIEITNIKPYTKSDVKQSLQPNCLEVKVFQDNTRSPRGKHYRVEGV